MTSDPWAFGWTQFLTIIGFVITIGIAIGGFRTFGRWRREVIEERRIETAIEALALSYELKYIFDGIRSPMSFGYEWKDMPKASGESDAEWDKRGPFYAVAKRIQLNKDFFERVYKLQPRCMAMFGKEADEIFLLMHKARRAIEVSSEMLAWKVRQFDGPEDDHNQAFYEQCRRDIWDMGNYQPENDKVGAQLVEFRDKMERMFRPVIDRNFKPGRI